MRCELHINNRKGHHETSAGKNDQDCLYYDAYPNKKTSIFHNHTQNISLPTSYIFYLSCPPISTNHPTTSLTPFFISPTPSPTALGLSIHSANTLSNTLLSRPTKTPILAHPRTLHLPSTSNPIPGTTSTGPPNNNIAKGVAGVTSLANTFDVCTRFQ